MTPNERLILAAAKNLATPEGAVSGRDIARQTGLGVTTVHYAIKAMSAAGAWPYRQLTTTERAAKGGSRSSHANRGASDAEVPERLAMVRAEKERQAREATAVAWEPPVVRLTPP